jgi:hypothetical protein
MGSGAGSMTGAEADVVELDTSASIWERSFTLFPLVVVGSLDREGALDLAPKHLAMPMSWQNDFGFVCTPRHRTYDNVRTTGVFTVTYVRPDQAVFASLAASPRDADGNKADHRPARDHAGEAHRRALPRRRLPVPRVRAAPHLRRLRQEQPDHGPHRGRPGRGRRRAQRRRWTTRTCCSRAPLLAYLYPGRFATVADSNQLPFPAGFSR